jgi:hypothetical protein
MRPIRLAAAFALAVLAAVPARAATVPYRTDAELIALATRVVRGRVLDSAAERAPNGTIRTRTRLAVLEDFTGGVDRVITVYELGGVLADGSAMSVPGSPRFTRGEDVVLCLERAGDGFRTVALTFSAFRVAGASTGGAALQRMAGDVAVVGAQRGAAAPPRTLEGFRATAAGVLGHGSRPVVSAAEAASMAAGAAVAAPYTLLGGGIRWREADSAQPILWYRNTLTPSPIVGADTDTEIRTALAAWTNPTGASITLTFAGTRLDNGPVQASYCTSVNAGAGIITFGDPASNPADQLPTGVLAIGGGCSTTATHLVNGRSFQSFTHGFIVFNDTQALSGFTTAPNITRILEHEIGHTIGLGHTCEDDECTQGDAINIMFPACCLAQTPIPPALGPDDLAGLVSIYPPDIVSCSFTVSPAATTVGAIGGSGTVTVTPSRAGCTWGVASNAPFVIVTDPGPGSGTGTVRFSVAPNFGGTAQRTATLTIATAIATVVQTADTDADGDALPDAWETFFALSASSNTGDDGPLGDPDHDGVSNAAELAAGTHPRGTFRRYLAEGAANEFFDTEIALFRPVQPGNAAVLLRIQPEGGSEVAWPVAVPAMSLRVVPAPIFKALAGRPFSTVIESDQPVVVDRTMRWDATGYGSSGETAVEAPSTTWYLAEGSTSGDFALFYLLQNPGDAAATATVRFLRPAPQAPIERTYTVAPRARLTIPVDAIPELVSTDVSGVITASEPIIVERAMYLSRPGQAFAAGHESAGVTAPATEWFLAEGATGTFFDLFVLIENPGTQAAAVRVDYLLPNGSMLSKDYGVAPESRFTIYVDDEQIPAGSGQRPLASAAVSMRITSTNGAPIIVERAMWWPQPAWYEAHNSPATTRTAIEWATASGIAGGPKNAETYVLIANPSATPAGVSVLVLYDQDNLADSTFITVPPSSRTTIPIGQTFATARGRHFGVLVGSVGAPVVVEQSVYESPGGVTWAAGTAASATPVVR